MLGLGGLGNESEMFKMVEDDFNKEIKRITKRAVQVRRQELAEEKAREREAQRIAKEESKERLKQKEKGSTSYTAVIIAKLEYEGDKTPTEEELADDLGRTIVKWASQKGFTGIDPKEPVPKLVSVDVDVQ